MLKDQLVNIWLLLFQQFATGELNRLNGGEGTSNKGESGSQYGRLAKFEFPKFYGEDVQGCLYRVNQFFLLDSIADDMVIMLLGLCMNEKSKTVLILCLRNPWVELKIRKHVTYLQLYQEQFEALMNKVELSEAYVVSLFIGGLKDEIGMHVRMFKPNTLSDVYCLAKMQEATLQAIKTRQTPLLTTPRTPYAATTSYANKTVSYPPKSTTTTLALPAPNTISKPAYVQPRKQLTQKEIADKRAKNLCFYCDEKFVPGHKCSGQLFLLEICADKSTSEEYELEALLEDPVVQNFGESITDTPVISLHAMTGESTYKTMKVKAYVGIYSALTIGLANGQVMSSLYECKGFTWTLQGVEFTSDVLILPLGGCELVLGVQWLSVLGDIKWNFKDLVMDFFYNGRRMVLRGTQKAALQWMNGKRQSKATSNGQVLCVYPNTLFSMTQTTTSPLCSQITDLLDSYQDVFVTPTSLPPKRKQDHRIPLVPNIPPINIRPYKHPPNQKDVVEAMVQEIMESGAIRDSQSPYSSPIVMVKKKDGTWRMCVDYRQLNKYTVKDKFPIPVVEELLDELSCANIISNLIEVAMSQAPVFAVPDFISLHEWKTDASGMGIGAVLQQGGHPIAYLSKYLSPKHQALSTYKKEFYAVLMALEKWRGLTTPFQAKWLPKLLGYDYEISYKQGSENHAADALSRISSGSELYTLMLYIDLLGQWRIERIRQIGGRKLMNQFKASSRSHIFHSDHSWRTFRCPRLQLRNGTMCIYWRGMKKLVKKFVAECDVCQRNKPDLSAYPGTPSNLSPIFFSRFFLPTKVWHCKFAMDFMSLTLFLRQRTVLFVVVDRLSKYAHFIPMSHPFTTSQVAQVFLDNVYKLHGMSNTIVSDRDKILIINSWQLCLKSHEGSIVLSTAIIPTVLHGQTEVVNKCVECYMRCMTGERPKEWVNSLEEVDRTMQAKEQAVAMLQFHLKRSQNRIKSMADKHRSDRNFENGTQSHVASLYTIGPFVVIAKVGEVAYKLQLPPDSTHSTPSLSGISTHKLRVKGNLTSGGVLPLCGPDGVLSIEPEAIIGRRLGKLNNKAVLVVSHMGTSFLRTRMLRGMDCNMLKCSARATHMAKVKHPRWLYRVNSLLLDSKRVEMDAKCKAYESVGNIKYTTTFLDLKVAKKLGCKLKATCPMDVSVANGQVMSSFYECKGFTWTLQGVEFTSDVLILPLGGCELVLGVQWLSVLGDIKWNFKDLVMNFVYNGRRMVLRGTQKAALQWMNGKRQSKATSNGQVFCVYPNTLFNMTQTTTSPPCSQITDLLDSYQDVFVTPTSLPPKRKQDHIIPLLMESGAIRDNQSPYSSPIVMVKKKDGTWRICVDYRQLNKYTVKDKFPIPVVEELLDELSGAQFFSKLNLRSGYHQIRMHEADIEKTAFRTHEGHYEFLVMPFGLTNAPSTFQALMNTVFKPFLRHFTLVFFDDILVYSATFQEHLQHLQLVLQAMRQNSLYAKMSKCIFAAKQVEYLGHIISREGNALPDFNKPFTVETDASGMGIGAVLQQGGHPIAYLRYLLDRHFKIKTDHFSLKYLLDQRLTTPFQAKWLPKLLGYDYEISYKQGSENHAADALSRISSGSELCSLILSTVTSDLLKQIKHSWEVDVDLQLLIQQLADHTYVGTKYTWTNGELRRKGKLVVGSNEQLRQALVTYFHSDPVGGHSGVQVTVKKLGTVLYWRGMKKLVKKFVAECDVCQRNKPDLSAYPGPLQPLPIPTKVWHDISMDFIEALPPSQGKTVLFVVTDGQTEVVNKCVECYMRCMTGERPKEWVKWVSLAEYWYNTNYHSSAHTTPFEIVYGQPPNLHLPYIAGTSSLEEVDRTMQAREQAVAMLQFHLKRSQNRIKSMADKHRSDRNFEVGMKVYLKLQPYRQSTVRQGTHHKFAAKYYGPFVVIAKVGEVAYKLQLPPDSQIHPVFHVSQLKLCKGTNHQVGVLPLCGPDGVLSIEPEAIIGRRLGKLNNKVVLYVLVKWVNQTEEEATWELYTDLLHRYPHMELHS
ncbi:retrotransposable element Tf2 [Tanacetum coccineum]